MGPASQRRTWRIPQLDPRGWSLSTRIAAMGIGLCGLLAMILMTLGYFHAASGLDEQAVQALGADARLVVNQVDAWNARRLQELRAVAVIPGVAGFLGAADAEHGQHHEIVQQLLTALDVVTPEVDSVSLIDRNGTLVASSNPNDLGQNVYQSSYFQAASQGNPFITGVTISASMNALVIFHAVPVQAADGTVVGVVRARSTLGPVLASVAAAEGRIGSLGATVARATPPTGLEAKSS